MGRRGCGGLGDKADCKFSYVGGSMGGSSCEATRTGLLARLSERLLTGLPLVLGLRAGLGIPPFNKIEFLDWNKRINRKSPENTQKHLK